MTFVLYDIFIRIFVAFASGTIQHLISSGTSRRLTLLFCIIRIIYSHFLVLFVSLIALVISNYSTIISTNIYEKVISADFKKLASLSAQTANYS